MVPTKRDASIDAFRVVAFLRNRSYPQRSRQGPRSNVPGPCYCLALWFCSAIFFHCRRIFFRKINQDAWDGAVESGQTDRSFVHRMGLFYTLLFKGSLSQLLTPDGAAHFFYSGGAAYHLWFLPALGVALTIYLLTKGRVALGAQLGLAAALYLFGYLFGSAHSIFHLPAAPFGVRNGPFFLVQLCFDGSCSCQPSTKFSTATVARTVRGGRRRSSGRRIHSTLGWWTSNRRCPIPTFHCPLRVVRVPSSNIVPQDFSFWVVSACQRSDTI